MKPIFSDTELAGGFITFFGGGGSSGADYDGCRGADYCCGLMGY